jgi:RHS repeat-associated protein
MSSSSSANANYCQCSQCADGYPYSWLITIAGVGDNMIGSMVICPQCGSMNKTWASQPGLQGDPQPGQCLWLSGFGAYCDYSTTHLDFERQTDGSLLAVLILNDSEGISFSGPAKDCRSPATLTYVMGPDPTTTRCNFGSAVVTIVPVGAPLSALPHQTCWVDCIPNALNVPVGQATMCCYPPGPDNCDSGDPCGCGAPYQATQYNANASSCEDLLIGAPCPPGSTPAASDSPGSPGSSPGGSGGPPPLGPGGGCPACRSFPGQPLYSRNILSETWDYLAQMRAKTTPAIPGVYHGTGHINMHKGFLTVSLAVPNAGPYDPRPKLIYSSKNALQSEYGYGWSAAHARSVAAINGSTAQITDGAGSAYRYTNKDASGYYQPPGGILNSLKLNGDSTWTETQPDGFKFQYDSTGTLVRLESVAGGRWTVGYDGGGRVASVTDPFSRRSTYAYDANNYIRRIVDTADRITTLSVDANGDLVSHTTPELCQTQLVYDNAHLLMAFVDPTGARTSYSYDSLDFVQSVTYPNGERVTYSWEDWTMTLVTDPKGQVTTVMHNIGRNVAGLIDPSGNRSTYTWYANRLEQHVDPLGHVTTMTYATLADNTKRLQSIIHPTGGAHTYLYDSNGRTESIIDPLGNRSTLVWDSNGNRTAVVNALGQRTSYLYNSRGQTAAEIDALGNRATAIYDSYGQILAHEDAAGARTSYVYQNGQPVRIQNPVGASVTYVRDQMNRIIAKIDPLGFRETFSYDLDGRFVRSQNAVNALLTTVYDANGRVAATINPIGARTTFAYDNNGNRIRSVNPLGFITTDVYDAANRRVATIDPLLNRSSVAYDRAGNVRQTLNPLGNASTYLYDADNRLHAMLSPLSARTTLVYDLAGRRIASVNPLGFPTTSVYDPLGRVAAVVDALACRTTTLYDSAGQVTANINARGYRATLIHDASGRLHATINATANRTTMNYDPAGRKVSTVNSRGYRTTSVYNLRGAMVATIDPLLNRTTMSFDEAGRPYRTQNALGYYSTTVFDLANRPLATINPLSFWTTMIYDLASRRIAIRDAHSNRTTTIYDAANRAVATENALGYRTTQVFDAANRRLALLDANSNRTSFSFDAASRNTLIQDAIRNRTSFTFDAAGRTVHRIDGRGLRTSYAWDPLNRLTGRRYSDGTRNTFSYDPIGSRLIMADVTGRSTSVYDPLQRLQSVTSPATQRITYAYNSTSNRTRLVTPDGGYFTYSWDAAGRISVMQNPLNEVTTFGFDALGRQSVQVLGNSTRASWTYDSANNITNLTNLNSSGVALSSFAYLYDAVGNRLRVIEANGDRVSWSYDGTYQLTHEIRDGVNAYNITHTWDPVGNRLVTADGGALTTATYNAANELICSNNGTGRTTFTFDGASNPSHELSPTLDRSTYTWDSENRLLKVSLPKSVINTMTYNADGLRVEKVDSSGTTKSLWDGQNILLDTNASNVTQTLYTLEPGMFGNLLSQSRSGMSSFFQFNAIGSIVGLTNLGQAVTDSYRYHAFGTSLNTTGSTLNPYRYVGRRGYRYDAELSDYYVRARYLSPDLTRWLSQDPSGFGRAEGLYQYVHNNPVILTDPSGLEWQLNNLECAECMQAYRGCVNDATLAYGQCMFGSVGWPMAITEVVACVVVGVVFTPIIGGVCALIFLVVDLVVLSLNHCHCTQVENDKMGECATMYNLCAHDKCGPTAGQWVLV